MLTEAETTEMEEITEEIIAKGGPTKGQIKKDSNPELVRRYEELAALIEPEPKKNDPIQVQEKPLSIEEARRVLLEARLKNGQKYSLAQRQTWKRELTLMEQGRWRGPLKPRINKGIYDEVMRG